MRLLEGSQAFYRAERATLQPTQLNEIVRGVLETTATPEGYHLEAELEPELPLVAGDAQLLDSALRALIRNAVEALAGAGTIRIQTDGSEGRVRLSVTDSGEGLDESAAAHVFEPFFTTRRSHAGLGLAMVARVVAAHAGEVYLESMPGHGTRVVLELSPA